jgi:ABC-type sugar transport system ATPase subunit
VSQTATTNGTPLLEVQNVSRYFGSVIALKDISMSVHAGEVMCLLGDNGAGKSTLIKIFSGVYPPSEGRYLVEGNEVHFSSPREALAAGIATVYQDLAMIPLMSISRNFFLGSEPTTGWGPFPRFDVEAADRISRDELRKMGIRRPPSVSRKPGWCCVTSRRPGHAVSASSSSATMFITPTRSATGLRCSTGDARTALLPRARSVVKRWCG